MIISPIRSASITILAGIVALLPCVAVAQDRNEPPILITGARIFDGVGPDLIEGKDVLVQDGLIAAIGENLETPPGAKVIDAAGRVMTPGLADMHAHLMFQMPFGVRVQDCLIPIDPTGLFCFSGRRVWAKPN